MGKKILVGVNYPGVEKFFGRRWRPANFLGKNREKSRKIGKKLENSEKINKNHENDPWGVNPGKKVVTKHPRE